MDELSRQLGLLRGGGAGAAADAEERVARAVEASRRLDIELGHMRQRYAQVRSSSFVLVIIQGVLVHASCPLPLSVGGR